MGLCKYAMLKRNMRWGVEDVAYIRNRGVEDVAPYIRNRGIEDVAPYEIA